MRCHPHTAAEFICSSASSLTITTAASRAPFREEGGWVMHTYVHRADRRTGTHRYSYLTQAAVKRAIDVVVSLVLLIIFIPIALLVMLAIWLDSPGPAFFNSVRVGLRGKPFVMYKFRTMVVDAEDRLKDLQALNRGGVLMVKIPNDPRVTRVGRPLRLSGLDELPQLLNVLKGEMSLVGPRPQYPREVAHYTPYQRRRLEAAPGITGLWQVSARDSADFDLWVKYDLDYIDRWSLWLDFQIILRTFALVLRSCAG